MKTFPDEEVEQFLRFWWKILKLSEIYDDITEEEFVRRCMKGELDGIEVSEGKVYLQIFTLFNAEYDQLAPYLAANNLTMSVYSIKDYYAIGMSIAKKERGG